MRQWFIIMVKRHTNIMVILKRIVKNSNQIEADYYPENGNFFGHLVVDIISGEISSITKAENDKIGAYAYHAKKQLLRVSALDVTPEESRTIWY